MLTEDAAVEIYKMKIALQQDRKNKISFSMWGKTRSVAKLFGVNTRTVKYVWNRQTWSYATQHLWASESELLHASIESRLSKEVKVIVIHFHSLANYCILFRAAEFLDSMRR